MRGSIETGAADLWAALSYPFASRGRIAITLAVAVGTYVLLILSTFPTYSMQMLSHGLQYFDTAVVALTQNTLRTVGYRGFGLIVTYAVLTGVAVTNVAAQFRLVGIDSTRDLVGVLPGLLASGCASCGAGVLGLLGFAGAMAVLPFHGDLLRVGGIVLLLGFLARSGDPQRCRVSPSS